MESEDDLEGQLRAAVERVRAGEAARPVRDQLIRLLRHGYTQVELAEMAGVTQPYISQLLRNHNHD